MCKRVLFLVVVAGLLSSSAFAADPNLFLHFEFDEGVGSTVTSTIPGASVSGTFGGDPGWDPNNVPKWINVAGSVAAPNGLFLKEDMGTGLDFDDIHKCSPGFYIMCGNDPNLNKATKALTFTFWMKCNSDAQNITYSRLLYKHNQWDAYFYNRATSWDNGFCPYKVTDGRMSESFQVNYSDAPLDQWNLWGYRYDPNENLRKCWVNGNYAATAWGNSYDPNDPLRTTDYQLKLFNRYTTVGQVKTPSGQFDDIRIFNRALAGYEFGRLPGTATNLALAYNESPQSGSIYQPILGVEITWSAGNYATTHKIFYGKDFDDVNTAVAGAAPAGVTEVDRALNSELIALGTLDLSATYYWRVDEGNSVTTWDKGPVWSFSTTNNALVEDFEAYVVDANLWKVWKDSWPSHGGTSNNSGATVKMEATTVNNGSGAMKLTYDNSDDWNYGTDHYSETEGLTAAMVSEGSSVVGGNFAYQGCKALDFYFKGDVGNAAQQMYIGFTDGTNTAVKVLKEYDRAGLPTSTPDVNAVQNPDWTRWQVDLINNMNSVNTSAITKVYLGIGVRGQTSGNPAGTVGTVYYDDLGLFQPRCYAQYVGTDFTGDCITDESDLSMMTGEWLNVAQTVNMPAPSAPTTGPILHYTFDNNDLTNSGTTGSTHDMNSEPGSYSFIAGKVGASALHFEGVGDNQAWIDDVNVINVNDITLSFWFKWEGVNSRIIRKMTWDSTGRGIAIRPLTVAGSGRWYCYVGDGSVYNRIIVKWAFDEDPAYSEWTHAVWAMARDVNGIATSKFYCDGSDIEQDQYYGLSGSMEFDTATYDWKNSNEKLEIGDYSSVSSFDDFRVYDYALTYAQARSVYGATQADSVIRGPVSASGGNAVTNISATESEVDQTINFKDFAEIGKEWMEEDLWPFAGCAE